MDGILEFINSLEPAYVYLAIFLAAFLENVFPPIPGDVVVIFGAYLVGRGSFSFIFAFIAVTIGSFLGFMGLYFIGFFFSDRLLNSKKFKFLHSKSFKQAEALFKKYGLKLVLSNRFLSGARSFISFIAGMYKLNEKWVALLSLISCALWNVILLFLGVVIGKNQEEILSILRTYNIIVFVVLIIIIILIARFKIFKNRGSNAAL